MAFSKLFHSCLWLGTYVVPIPRILTFSRDNSHVLLILKNYTLKLIIASVSIQIQAYRVEADINPQEWDTYMN